MRVMGAASLLPFLLPNCVALPGTAWEAGSGRGGFQKERWTEQHPLGRPRMALVDSITAVGDVQAFVAAPHASVADLTFLSALPRVIHRNVKFKATLESYGC